MGFNSSFTGLKYGGKNTNDDVLKFGTYGYGEQKRLDRKLHESQNSSVIIVNRLWAGSLRLGSVPGRGKVHGVLTVHW